MAIINQATKELHVKIVYYGPALCGKTTNIAKIHENVQSVKEKGKLVSLATSSDRTLFFDFLPMEAMAIKGFRTKFQLYTVPGQVIYNTTRQLVLRGVDGIVFVADSQYDKMAENVESFANLEENLRSLKMELSLHTAIQQARYAECGSVGLPRVLAEQSRGWSPFIRGLRQQV
jgi:mutual gliding-motility protein MglA